jgi:C4-dicarboxylate-specific signal transduction histidine kinase
MIHTHQTAELAADLPQVMGDRVQLQQVMMNLITTASMR